MAYKFDIATAYNISLAKTAGNGFDLKFFANFGVRASIEELC